MTQTMDLTDCIQYHQLSLQAEARSPKTLRLYLLYEKRFLHYLESQHIAPSLDALNPLNVRNGLEWFSARDSHGHRGGQVAAQAFVRVLKIWARFLETEGVYEMSPIARVKRPRVPKLLRQPFTDAEIVALWGASRLTRTPVRDEALLLLLFDTGMRVGEACALTLDKLRLDNRHVVVGLDGKGRRERLVPIGDPKKPSGGRAIVALRAWLKAREPIVSKHPERAGQRVFLTSAGYALTSEGGTDAFKRIGAIAGVAAATPHRARHTFCTHWLTANPGDELGLRRIVGHLSKEVLADYVHLSQHTIAERAGRTSLVESLSTPKQTPQRQASQPITHAWGAGSLGPPQPAVIQPRRVPVSELISSLDATERRA